MSPVSFPSPKALSRVVPFDFRMEGGGKHIVENEIRRIIARKGKCKVLEVGLFLGGSARRWLEVHPSVQLVGVDRFKGAEGLFDHYIAQNAEWAMQQIRKANIDTFLPSWWKNGQRLTFFRNMESFRRRITIYQGDFSTVADAVCAAHPDVDIIFLDGDQTRELIDMCKTLFPEAVLSGNRWSWGQALGYPVQEAVREYCAAQGLTGQTSGATWKVAKEPVETADG